MVTQYQKQSLRDYTSGCGIEKFDERRTVAILRPITEALYRLHKRNVVHRDLRMESIGTKVRQGDKVKIKLSCLNMAFSLKPDR